MRFQRPGVVVLAASAMLFSSGALAKHSHNQNNAMTQPSPATQPANADSGFSTSNSAPSSSPQSSALSDLESAKKALQDIQDKLFAQYQQESEWIAAQEKLSAAQAELDAAQKAAVASLGQNPDYQAAVAAKQKAVDDLAAAKKDGDASPETLTPLATASLQATMQLNKLQHSVTDQDPAVLAATQKVAAAQQALDALKAKFIQSLASDSDYSAAKAKVDAAQKNYDAAHPNVASNSNNGS